MRGLATIYQAFVVRCLGLIRGGRHRRSQIGGRRADWRQCPSGGTTTKCGRARASHVSRRTSSWFKEQDQRSARQATETSDQYRNPKQVTGAHGSVDSPIDERSLQILVRGRRHELNVLRRKPPKRAQQHRPATPSMAMRAASHFLSTIEIHF
jgi:hypothetical protein